ncbi:MAG: RDD family protein [Elusimicrobiota bacterium]|nr:MAG: RDD family protein [Elusimicrobiota bacterium]
MSHHHHHPKHHELRRAEFSERALAFAADYAAFAFVWYLILKVIDPGLPVFLNENGTLVAAALAALFLVYQTFFSCEGRVSLGKRLLGIRVADSDGEPLDFGRALMRALGYVPSSLFTAGFFWTLVDPHGRAWHDIAAGSFVVSDNRLPVQRGRVLRLSAGFLVIAFALAAGWHGIWEARYLKLMTVAHAKAGLREFDGLQKTYYAQNGRYAGSLFALAEASVDPRGFLRDMAVLYDLKAFRFKTDAAGWSVATRARDVDATLVAAHGP